jgi:uncharacterized membrane protein YecN with MAPEG domain
MFTDNPRAWALLWLLVQLLTSLGVSLLIGVLYKRFSAAAAGGSDTHRSFWLIALSITVIFLTVRTSIATGLTLIGALTLVRFRNPVKEPEEIGFILLVIASALAVTVWRFDVLGAILIITSVVLAVQTVRPGAVAGSTKAGLLVVTMPSNRYAHGDRSVSRLIHDRLYRGTLEGFTEGNGEVVVSYHFVALPEASFEALRKELRDETPDVKLNVIYHRPNMP